MRVVHVVAIGAVLCGGIVTPASAQAKTGDDLAIVSGADEDALARDLPSSRSVWSLLETVEPAAIADRISGAGLFVGEPVRFSMRGASWTQNRQLLDGADLTDPLTGGVPLVVPDVDALRAIEAVSALAPAEQPGPGVTLALALREPDTSWRGTVQGYALSSGVQQSVAGAVPPIARFGSLADASAVAGGPLPWRGLRLLASARLARARRLERADLSTLEDRIASGTLLVDWQASERDALRLLGAGQAADRPFAGRAAYSGPPVAEHVASGGATLRWTRRGPRLAVSALSGLVTGTFSPQTAGRLADRTVERLLDGPVSDLVSAARSQRGVWSTLARLELSPRVLGGLEHVPSFGASFVRTWSVESPGAPVSIAEAVDGQPARVWDYTWPAVDSRRHTHELAAWASERLRLRDRLQLEAGLRLEHTSGAADGAVQGVSWTTLVPRLSARLRLFDAGRIGLRGGYAEYQQRLLLQPLAFGDPAAPTASVSRWIDANGDGRFDPGERGGLVARVGPGAAGGLTAIDAALQSPRTREWVAGLEAAPGGWRVSLTGFDRREDDLVESVDVGVPASSYTVRYLPDPGGDIAGPQDDQLLPVFDRLPESFGRDRYLLTNVPGHRTAYQGVELRVDKAVGTRVLFLAGATASKTETDGANRGFRVNENDPGLVGELYDDPNADVYARGRGFFDRAFTIKIAGSWRAPGDLRLGVVARYQDGQPFARIVVVSDLAQGPEPVQATARGQQTWPTGATDPEGRPLTASGHRFSYTLTLDARIEKGVPLGRARLALVAEAFNFLGMHNEVEEDPVWGPRFREPVAIQPPRVFRFGARVDF